MAPPIVRLGLIGCGTVGSAFAEQLIAREPLLARRLGARIHLARVAVRDLRRQRPVPRRILCDDAASIAADPDIDVVIEATGSPFAGDWLRTALARGAAAVTAGVGGAVAAEGDARGVVQAVRAAGAARVQRSEQEEAPDPGQ